ncbi:MAG: 4-(cytidine 5'-diphospho)-2-C-methyl-D-erythritol kinase [Bacteroidetes bacterium 4572_114]|nr:MAG: 4-(cytidine 5'-diphospho)-2-C-methyl-D-erythritol kinase [Bacteroidetes bacterium 4572_114]
MVLFPNAKINLGLSVLQKRDDGFHNIETILYPIPINDALELIIAPDKNFTLTVSGLQIPGNTKTNLCVKAWELFQHDFNLPAVKIHLCKVIPMGAGLGGGSSDGAFMLKLIDREFQLGLSNEKLEEYARRLGSDCAFFIKNKPVFAFGKGDRLSSVNIDLSGYFLVLAKPDAHINTKGAYSGIMPKTPEISVGQTVQLPVEEWRDNLNNDFEKSIFQSHPKLSEIKERLYQTGAVYASMTGSGSAVYGLFNDEVDLGDSFEDHYYWSGWL